MVASKLISITAPLWLFPENMSKRSGEELDGAPLKAGQRPETGTKNEDDLDYADEFEDEFSEDDEIMEAGVDGRPDAERENQGTIITSPQGFGADYRRCHGY